jgi:SAM-dependent methyltransferase
MPRNHYTHCPLCGSPTILEVLKVVDHSVSGEIFPVMECRDCSLRFTQDIPDAASIGTYYQSEDYVSHTNTSRGMINKLYQAVRKYTLGKKRKLVQRVTGRGKGKLLDVGSGTGSFIHEMEKHGWETTGLEPDEGARKLARELYRVTLREPGELYKLQSGSFDAVTLWHVLEHVHELHSYIEKLGALIKEEGRIFIAVPNYTSTDATIYKNYWAAYDVPRHLYHFSPRSMQLLMKKHGLEILSFRPMWFDSFYISLLSSKYKKGKPGMLSAAWNGLRSNFKALGDVKKCSSVIYIIGLAGSRKARATAFP